MKKCLSVLSSLLFLSIIGGLFYFLFWSTGWDYTEKYSVPVIGAIKWATILGLFLFLTFGLYLYIVRSSVLKGWMKNIGLIVYSLLVVLLVLEGILVFVPVSQVAGTTLAYKRWRDYYWHPENELGLRDVSIVEDKGFALKKKIIAVGDSFTAGHGIKMIDERYTEQLQAKLPKDYRVINYGRDGVGTATEIYRLFHFPIVPEVIIFQYYGNDIEGECVAGSDERRRQRDEFFEMYRDYPEFGQPIKWFVKNSYLLNYLYWHAYPKDEVSYFDFIVPCYEDPRIRLGHLALIQSMLDRAKKQSSEVVVVLFPFMLNLDESEFYMTGMRQFFEARGVPVVDVRELSKDIPPKKRVVGKLDSHASPLVHKRIGEALYKIFEDQGWIH